MRKLILALALAAGPAAAQTAPKPVDPTVAALSQMVLEAQGREASALVKAYAAQAEAAAQKSRAEAAEAKTAKPDAAPSAR